MVSLPVGARHRSQPIVMKAIQLCLFVAVLNSWHCQGQVPWPFLYPNPENPGPDPFSEMRTRMIEQFDRDHDGYLSPSEREAVRRATKAVAEQRTRWVQEERRKRGGRRSRESRPPSRWLKLYDANHNERFDGQEWETARAAESKRVIAEYDRDDNGKLNEEEIKRVKATLNDRKLNGYDRYILRTVAGIEEERKQRGRSSGRQEDYWKAFDLNGDGKADPSELAGIRAAEQPGTDQ